MLSITLFSLYKSSHSKDIAPTCDQKYSKFEYVVVVNTEKVAQIKTRTRKEKSIIKDENNTVAVNTALFTAKWFKVVLNCNASSFTIA